MTLHLLRGRWWTIVCPPSGAFLNCRKGYIPISLCTLLPALTYPWWYTGLPVVCIVTQGPRGLPDTVPSTEVLN